MVYFINIFIGLDMHPYSEQSERIRTHIQFVVPFVRKLRTMAFQFPRGVLKYVWANYEKFY